jgi:hypothetical protein
LCSKLRSDEPPNDPGVQLCVRVWREVGGDRSAWGASLGPIPWDSVDAWCRAHGYDRDATDLIAHALAVADGARRTREDAKRERDRSAAEQAAKNRGGKGR